MAAEIIVRCAEVMDVCAIAKLIPNSYGGTESHSAHHISICLQMNDQNPFVLTFDKIVVSCVDGRHGVSDNDH